MRSRALSLLPAVLAYQAIPGLRLLPGGLALLVWGAVSLAIRHPPNQWFTLGLEVLGWGGAGGFALWYRKRYGRVRQLTSSFSDWQMLASMFLCVPLITYTQYLDRQHLPFASTPLVFAAATLFLYVASQRLCFHYFLLTFIFSLLVISPALLHSSSLNLFITPGMFGYGVLGTAMILAAMLDHRVIQRLFPPLPEEAR